VTVKYLKEQIEYTLYDDDFATEAIQTFKNSLEQALNFKMQIQSEYIIKGLDITIIFIQINYEQLVTEALLIRRKIL